MGSEVLPKPVLPIEGPLCVGALHLSSQQLLPLAVGTKIAFPVPALFPYSELCIIPHRGGSTLCPLRGRSGSNN